MRSASGTRLPCVITGNFLGTDCSMLAILEWLGAILCFVFCLFVFLSSSESDEELVSMQQIGNGSAEREDNIDSDESDGKTTVVAVGDGERDGRGCSGGMSMASN